MKVLHCSHNHHIVGGSDRVFFETTDLLERNGHQVVPFCVSDPAQKPTPWAQYFPKAADSASPKFRDTLRYFYNRDAASQLRRLLGDVGDIDIAHLHIYHGKLTPAILPILKRRGIPVVHSLHEYKLACPVYTMLRDGANCEKCVSGSPLNAIRYRCKGDSLIHSGVMAAEFASSRLLGDLRHIDRFICVSNFQRQIMARSGIPAGKLVTLHNFVDTNQFDMRRGHDDYLLYIGRIEKLKGVETLVKAARHTGHRLLIAGDGNWVDGLRDQIRDLPNISYLGFQGGAELAQLSRNATAIVVPSQWYENCPMSVLEAKAYGRPVIGARIGGIPELVRDGTDGFLFAPGEVDELITALTRLQNSDHSALSNAARSDAETRFSADHYLTSLMKIYSDARNSLKTQRAVRYPPITPVPTP